MEQENEQQLTFDFENVQPNIIRESADEIKLQLGDFDGPLDLLLYLIRKEKADIFDIPIARITEEYLRYIRLMESFDIALAAEFLVMAATLIEIKSKMLLPKEVFADEEESEDPRRELVDRLLEYEKFQTAAQMLYERSTVEQAVFRRGRIETDDNNTETNATVFDLLTVFQKIMWRHKEEIQLEIKREEISLAEMLRTLKRRIFESNELSLLKFFEEMETRRELVTAFVAVLEIVRTESVRLFQTVTFGDIILRKI